MDRWKFTLINFTLNRIFISTQKKNCPNFPIIDLHWRKKETLIQAESLESTLSKSHRGNIYRFSLDPKLNLLEISFPSSRPSSINTSLHVKRGKAILAISRDGKDWNVFFWTFVAWRKLDFRGCCQPSD